MGTGSLEEGCGQGTRVHGSGQALGRIRGNRTDMAFVPGKGLCRGGWGTGLKTGNEGTGMRVGCGRGDMEKVTVSRLGCWVMVVPLHHGRPRTVIRGGW